MSLSKPIGAKLWLGSLATSISQAPGNDSGPSTPIDPHPVNLVPVLDFTQWKQSGVYGMTEVKSNTFTNQATAGIALNIGAEAGKMYTVSFTMSRGAGALRLYISEEGTITTNDDAHDLTPGETTVDVVASGPWLTFRASVGDTTTTIDNLTVYEKVAVPPLDLNQMISDIIAERFSNNESGVLYVPAPVLLDQQVLFQNKEGSIPVEADGDPTGLMLDVSQGLELGAELWDAPVPNISDYDGTSGAYSNGTISNTSPNGGGSYPRFQFNLGLEEGKFYKVTGKLSGDIGTLSSRLALSGADNNLSFNRTTGELTGIAIAGSSYLEFVSVSGVEFSASIDELSVRELPGNHAYQDNSAARPVYRTDGSLHWLEFDGVDDYMSAGDVMDMQDENFILAASFIGGAENTAVVGKSQTASDGGRYFLAVKTYASFAPDAEGTDPTFTYTSGKGFTASLHRSISDGSLSTMINGAEISNRAMPAANHNSSRAFEIGRYATSYEFHSGPIYGVVCVRGAESLEDSLGPIADTLDNLRGAAQ